MPQCGRTVAGTAAAARLITSGPPTETLPSDLGLDATGIAATVKSELL